MQKVYISWPCSVSGQEECRVTADAGRRIDESPGDVPDVSWSIFISVGVDQDTQDGETCEWSGKGDAEKCVVNGGGFVDGV